MRTIPEELAARIASGVTTLAHVWRFTRRDGSQFGFTDHDRPLAFDAQMCEPAVGLVAGAIEKSLGLGVDTASVSGALSSDAITEADIGRGLWDGARVDIYRVDWSDPALRVHLFAGRIGEVRRGAQAFEAELRGLQAALNVPVGRVFSRFCDADLGDARCGKDVATAAFQGAATVTEVLSPHAFRASGLGGFEDGWFVRGRLLWEAGGEAEISAHRVEGESVVLEVLDPLRAVLAVGAAFTVTAGCDKRHETCRAKFANAVNFRGFPHMPGNDAIVSGPNVAEPMDGGSRFL
ncbi:DUF2163 domain-containing protein [Terricaulis sp.]|uniref:DUF2163 domain-containing protein n=1 Tax=Terricaulis sp. TaxID=2768686 RepID=UPI00378411C8